MKIVIVSQYDNSTINHNWPITSFNYLLMSLISTRGNLINLFLGHFSYIKSYKSCFSWIVKKFVLVSKL